MAGKGRRLTWHQGRRRGNQQRFPLISSLRSIGEIRQSPSTRSHGLRRTVQASRAAFVPARRRCRDGPPPASQYPRMSHGRLRLEPLVRIPCQAFSDEVDKEVVITFEDRSERFGPRPSSFTFGIHKRASGTGGICGRSERVSTWETMDLPKKSLRRDALSTMYRSGTPSTSMMQANCSCSFSPGKIGTPV